VTGELSSLERLLKRDRQIVVTALVLVAGMAWVYTMAGVGTGMSALEMTSMPWSAMSETTMSMPMTGSMPVSSTGYILVMIAMWWIMMVAMMLPSATPTILLAAALNRRSNSDRPPYGTAVFFTAGYLLAWFLFSVVAVVGQLMLESNGLMTAMMQSSSAYLSAGLLIAAGIWQFSPIKQACLRHCRSPVEYLTRHRRPGNRGALIMGMGHGTYCLGCCWFLMALLFAGGVMNLYWVAGLALFVLTEKFFSRGVWFSRITGAGLIIAGAALLAV